MTEIHHDDTEPTVKSFLKNIERIRNGGQISFLDATIEYCNTYSVEPEALGSFIKQHPLLLAKIQEDAEDLNFIKKIARLPI